MRISSLFLSIAVMIAINFSALRGEEKFWIFFTDKGQNHTLSVSKQRDLQKNFVSSRALERRRLRGMSLTIETDLPLESDYLSKVELLGIKIHTVSRWLNAISGSGSPDQILQVAQLPFVESVKRVKVWRYKNGVHSQPAPEAESGGPGLLQGYGFSDFQIRFHNIHWLHDKGLTGKGVSIAVFDTGFRLDHPALHHVQPRIIAEYDFIQMDSVTSNQPGDRSNQDDHGTIVLSVIASYLPDTLIGPAYDAQFLLAKTEIEGEELHVEEDHWMMAAEWAERLGADIVSSSLSYSTFDEGEGDYSYQDMDGQTTIITRAAQELARRGVLVVSSAGNEGNTPWHYITAPADGFYTLGVGSVNSNNNLSAFSSRGPSYDGRLKPDIVALGENVFGVGSSKIIRANRGTSYSCPLVTGIAAQILEQFPRTDLITLLKVLRKSGDQADFPDNQKGYGKIDALRTWELAREAASSLTGNQLASPLPNPYYQDSGIIFFPVDLISPQRIRLQIFNILGQKVFDVVQDGEGGRNLVTWNVRNSAGFSVAGGIYLYRIRAGSLNFAGKLTVF